MCAFFAFVTLLCFFLVVKMVRTYVRKTEPKAYTADDMARALTATAIGATIRAAARDYNIPEATLRHQWRKNQRKSLYLRFNIGFRDFWL